MTTLQPMAQALVTLPCALLRRLPLSHEQAFRVNKVQLEFELKQTALDLAFSTAVVEALEG